MEFWYWYFRSWWEFTPTLEDVSRLAILSKFNEANVGRIVLEEENQVKLKNMSEPLVASSRREVDLCDMGKILLWG